MTTTTQAQDLKPTVGRWTHYWEVNALEEADCGVVTENGYSVCQAPRYQTEAQWKADAELICQAHDAYEETGLTPMQLVARIQELETKPTSAAAQDQDQCRAEFEACPDLPPSLRFDKEPGGRYKYHNARIAWKAWQAAWNRRAAPTPPSMWQPIETAPTGVRVLLGPRDAPVVGIVSAPNDDGERWASVVHYNGNVFVAGYRCIEWMHLPKEQP